MKKWSTLDMDGNEEEKRTVGLCKNSYERISTTRIAFERAIVLVDEKPNAI